MSAVVSVSAVSAVSAAAAAAAAVAVAVAVESSTVEGQQGSTPARVCECACALFVSHAKH